MKKALHFRLKLILPWLILIVCTLYLISYFYKNSSEFTLLNKLDVHILLWLCLMQGSLLMLQGWRYYIVIRGFSTQTVPLTDWLRIHLIARFVNLIMPQLGNLYRAMRMKHDYGMSFSNYASGFTFFIWLSTIVTILMAIIVIALIDNTLLIYNMRAIFLLLPILALLLLLPLILWWLSNLQQINNRLLSWSQKKLTDAINIVFSTICSHRFWYLYILSSIIVICLGVLIIKTGFAVFDNNLSIAQATLIYACLHFLWLVPITPANLGVQELSIGALAAGLGFTIGEGVIVSVLLRFTTLLSLSILAIPVGAVDAVKTTKLNKEQNNYST